MCREASGKKITNRHSNEENIKSLRYNSYAAAGKVLDSIIASSYRSMIFRCLQYKRENTVAHDVLKFLKKIINSVVSHGVLGLRAGMKKEEWFSVISITQHARKTNTSYQNILL